VHSDGRPETFRAGVCSCSSPLSSRDRRNAVPARQGEKCCRLRRQAPWTPDRLPYAIHVAAALLIWRGESVCPAGQEFWLLAPLLRAPTALPGRAKTATATSSFFPRTGISLPSTFMSGNCPRLPLWASACCFSFLTVVPGGATFLRPSRPAQPLDKPARAIWHWQLILVVFRLPDTTSRRPRR